MEYFAALTCSQVTIIHCKGWYWWEESSAAISRRVHFFSSLSQLQVGSRVSDISIVKFCQEKVFHVGGTTGAGAPIRA